MNTHQSKSRQHPLRSSVVLKSTIMIGVVMAALAVIQILYSNYSTRQQIEAESLEQLRSYYQIYETHIEAESNAAQALALSIASRDDIKELYLRGDRKGMYDLLLPLFEQMKDHQIVHLYIHNADGTVFLRVHDPEKFEDDITYRATAAEALAQETVTSGVEVGPNRIGIRGVAPFSSQGNFIGLIEVGIDFDEQFVSTLKEINGADYTMWVSYDAAARAGLKPAAGDPVSPFEKVFYYTSTQKDLLPIPAETYQSVYEKNNPVFQIVNDGTKSPSMVYLTPLLGYKGKQIGLLEISVPYADTLQKLNDSILTIVGITVGTVLLGLLLISFFNSQVILKPLAALSEFAGKQLAGDLKARVSVQTGDEFSRLAAVFNNLAESIEDERRLLEQRVTDRTKALATSTEVSRRLSTILDQKKLVNEVVNQIKDAFGYYHTQIYFYDETGENLIMAGGTGEAGEMMLSQFHKVAKGRGLVGQAAEINRAVLVSDTSKNPEWLPNMLLPHTKSEVAIPISIGDEILGVLDVQQNIVDGLKQEDIDSLQSIANQIAVALQNIQSTEIVTKRAAELQTVARISTVSATIGDVQKMLESVVHLTQRGFGLYHAHVFTYNENNEMLEIVACGYKEGDEHEGTHGTTTIPIAQEQSLVARAARTRQAVIVNDVRSDPGWLPNPLLPDTASEMAVPMIVGNQLLGVLDVQSERINAFSEEDASIQTTLASQIAVAVQNAHSFLQSQRQAKREAEVNIITQKIQNAPTIEAAMQVAARELGHALGMRPTLVALDPSALRGETGNEHGE